MGMLLMGGWAQGVFKHAGAKLGDFMHRPRAAGQRQAAASILNADAFIFWKRKEPTSRPARSCWPSW